jgi:ribosomal-protein-serine acetyltransferase
MSVFRAGIRSFELDDVDALFLAISESKKELTAWMPWCHADYCIEDTKNWIEQSRNAWAEGRSYNFAIYDRRSGQILGGCGVDEINPVHRLANLGYWVRTSATGQNVATEAALLAANFAFSTLALNRLDILVADGNGRSQRVAEKVGAKREGLLRSRLVTREGQTRDAFLFSLLPRDLGLAGPLVGR